MKRKASIYVMFVFFLGLLTIVNINIGSVNMSLKEIFNIILKHDISNTNGRIIWDIRLPRIMAAIILGGALSVSGYMLQTFFHNSIAGPFVLGISSGAKLMVAFLMIMSIKLGFYVKSMVMISAAFIGAILVTLLVLFFAQKVRQMSILIVCGVMVGYICSAVTELVISFAEDSNIVNLHSWSMGSFSAINWKNVGSFLPVIVLCMIIGIFMTKQMEAYSYGEEYAESLGVRVKSFRVLLIIVSSIMSATVTAFAGPISFVGIAAPHMARKILNSDRPIIVLPASFLLGSLFCLLSDLLARSLFAPVELSISTMTAVFGAPIVILMLLNNKRNN